MDPTGKSYFAAAGGPTALTAELAELEALHQTLANKKKGNVIIPETGAAKYWYVDPRAERNNSPAALRTPTPLTYRTPLPGQFRDEGDSEPTVRELMTANQDLRAQRTQQLQERADVYDKIRHPGMLEPPSADHELAEATGTFKIGNETYILPTQVGGQKLTPEQAMKRFMDTGEHMGVFENPKAADFFEKNYLYNSGAPQPAGGIGLLPANTPNILKRRILGNAPRLAGNDRKELLDDIEGTFYGGGQAPAPTPTPTPQTRMMPVSFFT